MSKYVKDFDTKSKEYIGNVKGTRGISGDGFYGYSDLRNFGLDNESPVLHGGASLFNSEEDGVVVLKIDLTEKTLKFSSKKDPNTSISSDISDLDVDKGLKLCATATFKKDSIEVVKIEYFEK